MQIPFQLEGQNNYIHRLNIACQCSSSLVVQLASCYRLHVLTSSTYSVTLTSLTSDLLTYIVNNTTRLEGLTICSFLFATFLRRHSEWVPRRIVVACAATHDDFSTLFKILLLILNASRYRPLSKQRK